MYLIFCLLIIFSTQPYICEYTLIKARFPLGEFVRARTDKKVGTFPTCSRRIFSPANFNQSRYRIFIVFASRRANKFA